MKKTVHLRYFALLKEERGLSQETIQTTAVSLSNLYAELKKKYELKLPQEFLKVAVNNEFKDWTTTLKNNDSVAFIPPVAGG